MHNMKPPSWELKIWRIAIPLCILSWGVKKEGKLYDRTPIIDNMQIICTLIKFWKNSSIIFNKWYTVLNINQPSLSHGWKYTSEHQSFDYGFLCPTIKQIQHNMGWVPSYKRCFGNLLNANYLSSTGKPTYYDIVILQGKLHWSHALNNTSFT